MSILTRLTGVTKTKLIKPGDIASPTLNLDDFVPANMMLEASDFDHFTKIENLSVVHSADVIQPFGVPFGISSRSLLQFLKKPAIIINNEENIQSHEIHLIRRKLGKIIIASQFHFIKDKLFLVVDEFNRQRDFLERALKKTINGYFLLIPEITDNDVGSKNLKDEEGHILCVEYQNHFVTRYFSPGIWEENKPSLNDESR